MLVQHETYKDSITYYNHIQQWWWRELGRTVSSMERKWIMDITKKIIICLDGCYSLLQRRSHDVAVEKRRAGQVEGERSKECTNNSATVNNWDGRGHQMLWILGCTSHQDDQLKSCAPDQCKWLRSPAYFVVQSIAWWLSRGNKREALLAWPAGYTEWELHACYGGPVEFRMFWKQARSKIQYVAGWQLMYFVGVVLRTNRA